MGSPWKGFVEFTLPTSPPAAFISADLSSTSPVGLSLSPYGRSVSSIFPTTSLRLPPHRTPIHPPCPASLCSDWPYLSIPRGSETSLCSGAVKQLQGGLKVSWDLDIFQISFYPPQFKAVNALCHAPRPLRLVVWDMISAAISVLCRQYKQTEVCLVI